MIKSAEFAWRSHHTAANTGHQKDLTAGTRQSHVTSAMAAMLVALVFPTLKLDFAVQC